jgi:hypothetical protein
VKATPQLLEKWLAGSKPGDSNLRLSEQVSGVEYRQLKMLISGIPAAADPAPNKFSTRTDMGESVGRKWEEINEQNDVAAISLLSVMETLVTLQRDSHPRYAKHEQERAPKVKAES